MALSTTGYTVSGAGMGAANGNYVPVVGANATWNGATQYTYSTYFLTYNSSTSIWTVAATVNNGAAALYYVSGGSSSVMPLTGWGLGPSGTPPAPTFADMSGGGGATVVRRPPIFF